MPESARIVCLPDGLELLLFESEQGIRLESSKRRIATTGVLSETTEPAEPSVGLRARRFGTIEELEAALRRELAA